MLMQFIELFLIIIVQICSTAFFGIIPPFLVGWYIMKKGQKYAKERTDKVLEHAEVVLGKKFDEAVDGLKSSLRDSLNGYMGNKVSQLKNKIDEKFNDSVDPFGKLLGDFAGEVAEDYGYGKKKNVATAIKQIFQKKKSPEQIKQEENIVKGYLSDEETKVFDDFKKEGEVK